MDQRESDKRLSSAIIAACLDRYGVRRDSLTTPTRAPQVVLCRQLIAYLCRDLTSLSFPEIARAMGKTGHSSVIELERRCRQRIKREQDVRMAAKQLTKQLTGSAAPATTCA